MKKLAIQILCIILVSLLMGCAPAATPTPAPAPAPTVTIATPTPVLGPTVTVTTPASAPAAPAHEIVTVDILTSTFGSDSYTHGIAFSDLLKKNHPWLRATVAETPGPLYNLEFILGNPSLWKNTVFITGPRNVWLAQEGLEPFTAPMNTRGIKGLGNDHIAAFGIVTFDPNIKTVQDLVGKKLAIGMQNQMSYAKVPAWLLGDGLGILDKINIQRMLPKDMPRSLLDGLVDASMFLLSVDPSNPKQWVWGGPFVELANSGKEFNYISWPQEAFVNLKKTLTMDIRVVTFPAGTLPNQTTDVDVYTDSSGFYAKDVFPEDTAYEFSKFLIENHDKFADYISGAKLYSPEYFAYGLNMRNIHLGALQAYEEAGIKIPED